MTPLESAQRVRAWGGWPIPIPDCEKGPKIDGWPDLRLEASPKHFYRNGTRQNVGCLLGEPYGLTDIDLDCPEAISIWPTFAPDTSVIFGRKSARASHWFYYADPPQASAAFVDPLSEVKGEKLVEIRCLKKDGSIGLQTVVPPSHHKDTGEQICFEPGKDKTPANVEWADLYQRAAKMAAAALFARHWPAKGRHDTMLALAGVLCRTGWPEDDAKVFCRALYRAVSTHDPAALARSDGEIHSTYEKIAADRAATGIPTLTQHLDKKVVHAALQWLDIHTLPFSAGLAADTRPEPDMQRPTELPNLIGHLFNDYGNAQRVITLHGAIMRYCHASETWLHWKDGHWATDEDGRARRQSQDTIIEFGKQAMALNNQNAAKFAASCLNSQRITNSLREAQPHLAITLKELDRDPFLFNCLNGTIELRTGRLREHRREDFITKLAPVNYNPAARSELWDRAIDEWTGGNKELQDFLQRAIGYSLTGDTREEVLFFVHGPAAAGKSSFLEAIKTHLGDYAKTADFDAFIQRRDFNVRSDIAELAGRRFVVSIEVDEGKRLAEGLIKMLTGGDTVRARFLYQEGFEFLPQFKLWLAANHAPKVRHDDSAMWRRILRIPFENVIPKDSRDPTVKARLKDPNAVGPAILAWAVEGCLRWQEERLQVPNVVEQATEEYRQDMDPLKQFFDDCCAFGNDLRVTAARLHQEYEIWCRENGERQITGKEFNQQLRARNCTPGKVWVLGKDNRGWFGLGVPPAEREKHD